MKRSLQAPRAEIKLWDQLGSAPEHSNGHPWPRAGDTSRQTGACCTNRTQPILVSFASHARPRNSQSNAASPRLPAYLPTSGLDRAYPAHWSVCREEAHGSPQPEVRRLPGPLGLAMNVLPINLAMTGHGLLQLKAKDFRDFQTNVHGNRLCFYFS